MKTRYLIEYLSCSGKYQSVGFSSYNHINKFIKANYEIIRELKIYSVVEEREVSVDEVVRLSTGKWN